MTALHLANLKAIRMRSGITAETLSNITGIARKRMKRLETMTARDALEPTLTEAALISRVLNTAGIRPLLADMDLRKLPLDFDPRPDIDVWRTGCELPLTTACRLTLKFGLDDPIQLYDPRHSIVDEHGTETTTTSRPLLAQLWSIVATGERVGAPGTCPWCIQPDGQHLDTCIPNNLLHPRNLDIKATIGIAPHPRVPGINRAGAQRAHGLKRLRLAKPGTTQAVMAASIGINVGNYAQIENGARGLSKRLAEQIAATYRIDPNELYLRDDVFEARGTDPLAHLRPEPLAVGSSDIEGDA